MKNIHALLVFSFIVLWGLLAPEVLRAERKPEFAPGIYYGCEKESNACRKSDGRFLGGQQYQILPDGTGILFCGCSGDYNKCFTWKADGPNGILTYTSGYDIKPGDQEILRYVKKDFYRGNMGLNFYEPFEKSNMSRVTPEQFSGICRPKKKKGK